MERAGLGHVVDPEPERLDEPTTVREIVTLEAVVQRVRAERIVAQPHQDVDDPDGDRGRHNHTERDRKPAHARHPTARKLL